GSLSQRLGSVYSWFTILLRGREATHCSGYGLLRRRRFHQPQAFYLGCFDLRGYDRVRSRRLEHRVEHAQQLPGHCHDGPLATAALFQSGEECGPLRTGLDQPPGRLDQGPAQQSRALLGDCEVLGFLATGLPHLGHQSRVSADLFGVGKSAAVSQFTDEHLVGHESHTWSCLDDRSGFFLAFRCLGDEGLDFRGYPLRTRLVILEFGPQLLDHESVSVAERDLLDVGWAAVRREEILTVGV